MSWLKVDDKFHSHPKVVELLDMDCGLEALGLWTLLGAWCADYGSNGEVTAAALRRNGARNETVTALVTVGLWSRNEDGGIVYHDWSKYQPTKREAKSTALTNAERQQRHREKHSGVTKSNGSNVTVTPRSGTRARFPDPDPVNKSTNVDSSESVADAPDVRRVFECWIKLFWSGRGPKPKLDDKRRRRIRARLKTFTADQLCEALGRVDSWYVEKGHTGLETLLRDDAQVEKHLGALKRQEASNGPSGYDPDELLRSLDRLLEANHGG